VGHGELDIALRFGVLDSTWYFVGWLEDGRAGRRWGG